MQSVVPELDFELAARLFDALAQKTMTRSGLRAHPTARASSSRMI
jgi:hypothetical protein